MRLHELDMSFLKTKTKSPGVGLQKTSSVKEMNIQLKDQVRRLDKITKIIWLKLNPQHKSPQSQARTWFHNVVDTMGYPLRAPGLHHAAALWSG